MQISKNPFILSVWLFLINLIIMLPIYLLLHFESLNLFEKLILVLMPTLSGFLQIILLTGLGYWYPKNFNESLSNYGKLIIATTFSIFEKCSKLVFISGALKFANIKLIFNLIFSIVIFYLLILLGEKIYFWRKSRISFFRKNFIVFGILLFVLHVFATEGMYLLFNIKESIVTTLVITSLSYSFFSYLIGFLYSKSYQEVMPYLFCIKTALIFPILGLFSSIYSISQLNHDISFIIAYFIGTVIGNFLMLIIPIFLTVFFLKLGGLAYFRSKNQSVSIE